MLHMEVQDVPRSRYRPSLGAGIVVETRELGFREQVLVEFPESGKKEWLPWQNLRHIKGVNQRLLQGKDKGGAEEFRLRCLAYALELWNENTGALSHLEIDPLPHQIHLVHHILASGNLNWLIADDVGLGKTIEVGMLLAALQQRGLFRRILLITPAGLTRQWQEELHHKFGFDDFVIYGEDFHVNEARQWKLYDHVIGSIDRFKVPKHFHSLMEAGYWDLIVFDEAHRLSRTQYGMRYEASDRFKLAAALRRKTDSLLLLSATPHQGRTDKFQALLELLRPEWKEQIALLDMEPSILKHMVIRNHKADVTDVNGNFIFKGKLTRAIEVEAGEEAKEFDAALSRYLKQGYAASRQKKGKMGRAIGFVMTVYRKLAASSAQAILDALIRRRERLRVKMVLAELVEFPDDELDQRFAGEYEESIQTSNKEFFTGELELLDELILKAERLLRTDKKIRAFIEGIVDAVLEQNRLEKILIFTEYRSTQNYIAEALGERFGHDKVELINGSQKRAERAEAIARFEDEAQFLISTEAGGEGINLQRKCHVMVNFDLPWNPMRLVQRIGRLYRYGQQKKVVVLNVHAPQTLDGQIMGMMYDRIEQVVRNLAVLGGEFNDRLADEILGEFSELVDVADILEEASNIGISRTRERIDEALRRAREATEKQRELFEHVSGYDPREGKKELGIGSDHLASFVEAMFERTGVELRGKLHKGAVWEIKLPETLVERMPGRGALWRVTLDRTWGASRPDIHMLDLSSPLMKALIEEAKALAAGGLAVPVADLDGIGLVAAILRWQNDQGRRMRQEFSIVQVAADGTCRLNPEKVSEWLKVPARRSSAPHQKKTAQQLLQSALEAFDSRLDEVSNLDIHPENRQLIGAGWC